MKGQLRIDQMFAFIVRDSDNTEGVCAFLGPGGLWVPMVGADLARVEQLKPIAQELANTNGRDVELCFFSDRKHVETIKAKQR